MKDNTGQGKQPSQSQSQSQSASASDVHDGGYEYGDNCPHCKWGRLTEYGWIPSMFETSDYDEEDVICCDYCGSAFDGDEWEVSQPECHDPPWASTPEGKIYWAWRRIVFNLEHFAEFGGRPQHFRRERRWEKTWRDGTLEVLLPIVQAATPGKDLREVMEKAKPENESPLKQIYFIERKDGDQWKPVFTGEEYLLTEDAASRKYREIEKANGGDISGTHRIMDYAWCGGVVPRSYPEDEED